MDGTKSNLGGWGYGGVRSGWIFEGAPPSHHAYAAPLNFAELHAHTSPMSKVGQRFLDFYIAATEQ